MTRKSLISNAELKRFAALATSEGVTIEIERDGTIIRIMPFRPIQSRDTMTREEKAEAALAKWIENRD